MTAANVTFLSFDKEEGEAGWRQQFGFDCPKHKGRRCEGLTIAGTTDLKRDGQGQNGGIAQWDWNGDPDRPTFSPSINCKSCWHGYIRNGRCVNTSGQDEPGD